MSRLSFAFATTNPFGVLGSVVTFQPFDKLCHSKACERPISKLPNPQHRRRSADKHIESYRHLAGPGPLKALTATRRNSVLNETQPLQIVWIPPGGKTSLKYYRLVIRTFLKADRKATVGFAALVRTVYSGLGML